MPFFNFLKKKPKDVIEKIAEQPLAKNRQITTSKPNDNKTTVEQPLTQNDNKTTAEQPSTQNNQMTPVVIQQPKRSTDDYNCYRSDCFLCCAVCLIIINNLACCCFACLPVTQACCANTLACTVPTTLQLCWCVSSSIFDYASAFVLAEKLDKLDKLNS